MTNGQSAGKPLKGVVKKMNLIGVNAKLGDGHLSVSSETSNARAIFNGKNVQWVSFKRDLAVFQGFEVSNLKPKYSGYKDSYSLVGFSTKTDERLTYVYKASRKEVIESLLPRDLIMWYIDDGSWHKSRKTMHLYCNSLDPEEVQALVLNIESYYGIKPAIRKDRKKDGREYPYLYFPRKLVERFKEDVRTFLVNNELDTLYYKIGETSETIRNGVGPSESEKGSSES